MGKYFQMLFKNYATFNKKMAQPGFFLSYMVWNFKNICCTLYIIYTLYIINFVERSPVIGGGLKVIWFTLIFWIRWGNVWDLTGTKVDSYLS